MKKIQFSVVFQIRLLSTWGDEFYIGLNGIELYNRKGELMKIREHSKLSIYEIFNISVMFQTWQHFQKV